MAGTLIGQQLALLLVVAGAGLVIAEALAPGAHFIVLGVSLLVAGLLGLVIPPSLGLFAPLVLAATVIVVGGITLYGYRQFDFYGGKGAGQTSDSGDLRGKTGRVTEEVTETSGEVKLDSGGFNPNYRARCLDGSIPEGTEVIVVDPGGGNVVTVEALDEIEDEIDRELARDPETPESGTGDPDAA
ncbi:NfeD family protein [Halorientalis marina]|jgi:membrane protein implicated in regulation of membrane protease activity|uniref:NfeD family protein n=1 Tax=Halorientalis marina TaxID=2931976 RepID=UPI001FF3F9B0|nr:NfeD family protein [Halorientalis marina]